MRSPVVTPPVQARVARARVTVGEGATPAANARVVVTALAALVGVVVVACPANSDRRACNQDIECFVGERCLDGGCVVVAGEGEGEGTSGEGEGTSGEGEGASGEGEGTSSEGEGASGEGEGASGEGEGASGEGEGASGEGEGASGEGEGEGQACGFVDENFDDGVIDPPLFVFGPQTPFVGGSELVLDLDKGVSNIGVGEVEPADFRNAHVRVHMLDAITTSNTQQYIDITNVDGTEISFLDVEETDLDARIIHDGVPDDVTGAVISPPYDLVIDFVPVSFGDTEITFSAEPLAGPAHLIRQVTVSFDLSGSNVSFLAQTFAAPDNDPPPLHFDDIVVTLCP